MLCQFIRRKMGNRLCILNVKIFYSLLNNQEDGHLLPYIPDAAFRKDSHWLACWFINSQPRLSPVGSRDGLCLTTGFHIYLSEQCDWTRAATEALWGTRAHLSSKLTQFSWSSKVLDSVESSAENSNSFKGTCLFSQWVPRLTGCVSFQKMGKACQNRD